MAKEPYPVAEPKASRFVQVDFPRRPTTRLAPAERQANPISRILWWTSISRPPCGGLVKSLVLDKRSEIGALSHEDLTSRPIGTRTATPCSPKGNASCSALDLTKLRKLEVGFQTLDAEKQPKMLVVCEDTTVTPLVEEFMRLEGARPTTTCCGSISTAKASWKTRRVGSVLRERLFDVDQPQCAAHHRQCAHASRGIRRKQHLRHRAASGIGRRHSCWSRPSAAACASCGAATNTTTSNATIAN